MEEILYINEIYDSNSTNILTCFICDQPSDPLNGNGVFIKKSQSQKLLTNHLEILKNILNDKCFITLCDTDVFCETCMILLEELDIYKLNVILFEQMFLRQLYRKYKIENLLDQDFQLKLKSLDIPSMNIFTILTDGRFICKRCDLIVNNEDGLSPHFKYHEVKDKIILTEYNDLNEESNIDNLISYSPNYTSDGDQNEIETTTNLEVLDNTTEIIAKTCSTCRTNFYSTINYNSHLFECLRKNSTEISILNTKQFSQNINLEENDNLSNSDSNVLNSENDEEYYECTLCNFKTNQEDVLQSHTLLKHKDMIEDEIENNDENIQNSKIIQFLCPRCDYENPKYSNITAHIAEFHPEYDTHSMLIQIRSENSPKCKNCGDQFNNEIGCDHKNVLEKGWKKRKCSKCDEYFYTDFLIKEHLRKIHLTCEFCDKNFSTFNSLKYHEYKHKNGTTYKCSECEKTFKTKHGLIYHMPKHTGVYKYYCEICNRGFMHPKFLEQHMGVHTKADKYVCDICGTKFSFNATYRLHLLWHENPYPYECKECGKKFKHTSVLAVHRRREHSGERPYKCKDCDKAFYSTSLLKRHSITHSQTFAYNCKDCVKGFHNRSNYGQHLFKIHNDPSMINKKKCEYKIKLRPEYQNHTILNNKEYSIENEKPFNEEIEIIDYNDETTIENIGLIEEISEVEESYSQNIRIYEENGDYLEILS